MEAISILSPLKIDSTITGLDRNFFCSDQIGWGNFRSNSSLNYFNAYPQKCASKNQLRQLKQQFHCRLWPQNLPLNGHKRATTNVSASRFTLFILNNEFTKFFQKIIDSYVFYCIMDLKVDIYFGLLLNGHKRLITNMSITNFTLF